ncbi:MAG: vancomycin resistance protein, partial [Lachnospiraceae bacterium]|nr:vancomycin resistance protein [Lachnospiraceae bacterium]
MKKLLVTVVAVLLMLSGTISVSAAGLKDVFSAQYYSDQYKDLKTAFGTDEAMLFQHFVDYGVKEGR